ncbi:hypothetical protein B0H13DRAFT_1908438 [Mycena leptocephala]|nr:hypothetical protein B0H13DRAFT_1908438 [Mycena leptocephala]
MLNFTEQAAFKELEARVNARTVAGPSGQASLRVQIPEQPDITKGPGMDYGLFNSKGLIANPDYLDYHSPQNELLNNDDADGDPNQRVQSPVEAGEPEIKRVFHPHSKRPPQFQFFQDFVRRPKRAEPTDSQPWRPFRSQLDFEVAEFCETNMLNKDSTQTLISLIHRCNATPEDFTLASQRELDELWELASHKCTEFARGTITVQYKNENKTYDTHTRPLWDWARSLIQDRRLASSFVWDAEKAYKFDGETYVRFYQEPWTADAFWTAQKAYAVVARLANVVIETRNSTQFGGGQVVGHQPIVGDWMDCGDDIRRWLWPIILILAADYEEASSQIFLRNIHIVSHKILKALFKKPRTMRTAAEREELLKDNGLRDVENAFWKIRGADPHKALSFDPLHADDGGFWGSHLFSEIKKRATELGREAIVKIDEQGLNHFDSVMNTTFNDGSKHADVAKMMLFAAHNVLVDEPGLLLLQALRSYLELRTAIKFEVHTSDTLAVGRDEILTLDSTMKRYIAACEETELYGNKDWNVPKFHSRWHASMILNKRERVEILEPRRLVKHDHRRTVATYIREQIEALNGDPSESPEDTESTVLSNIDIGSKIKPVSFVKLEQDMSHDAAFHRFRVKFGIFITQFLAAHNYNLPNAQPVRFDGTTPYVLFSLEAHLS